MFVSCLIPFLQFWNGLTSDLESTSKLQGAFAGIFAHKWTFWNKSLQGKEWKTNNAIIWSPTFSIYCFLAPLDPPLETVVYILLISKGINYQFTLLCNFSSFVEASAALIVPCGKCVWWEFWIKALPMWRFSGCYSDWWLMADIGIVFTFIMH